MKWIFSLSFIYLAGIAFSFCEFSSLADAAVPSRSLVQDAESLVRQVSPGDKSYQAVSLRLADLYFDSAVEIDADSRVTKTDVQTAATYRRRALEIYQRELPRLSGRSAAKVRFQISRLHVYLGQMESAVAQWKVLIKQPNTDKRIRRESALHLAEQMELANRRESISTAVDLYNLALPLAEKKNLEGYIIYRLAWAKFRLGQSDEAVRDIRKSLALAEASEKPDRTKDLALFLSRSSQEAEAAMKILRGYQKEVAGQNLLANLAEAYLAADRKAEYAIVTEAINREYPALERSVALLDVNHDRRSPAQLKKDLQGLLDAKARGSNFSNVAAEKQSLDTVFRLLIFWDGQRKAGRTEYEPVLASGTDVMVQLFPNSEETQKAFGTWTALKATPAQKKNQIERWLPVVNTSKNAKLAILMRQQLIELARQTQEWPTVVSETSGLEPMLPLAERRAVRYQRAKALYELRNYDEALPLFIEVAETGKVGDELTKFSQDLVFNILDVQKNYDGALQLATKWKSVRPDMDQTADKALFEKSAADQDAPALGRFTQFCTQGKFLPQSCANAESLARRLNDRTALIVVLTAQGKEEDLARELELSGRFSESARILEKHHPLLSKSAKSSDAKFTSQNRLAAMKVALLYELQGDLKERDRVLLIVAKSLPNQLSELDLKEQTLHYQTFADAGLLNDTMISWAWKEEIKTKIAGDLVAQSGNSKKSTEILLQSCANLGPAWERAQLQRLAAAHDRQFAIKFIGKNGEAKFKKRVEALKAFSEHSDCFAKTASPALRNVSLEKVSQAYANLVQEIRSAPIPDGLDEETLTEVKSKIDQIAAPFEKLQNEWHQAAEKAALETQPGERLDPATWNFAATSPEPEKRRALVFDWQSELSSLQKNPFDVGLLQRLKTRFEQKGSPRLAAYFGGRLEGLSVQ